MGQRHGEDFQREASIQHVSKGPERYRFDRGQ